MCFVNAFATWLSVCRLWIRRTSRPSQAYQGASWIDTIAVCSVTHNFQADKGLAIGLIKSLYGLSASLLTTCYENLFQPNVTQYLLFLAILCPGTIKLLVVYCLVLFSTGLDFHLAVIGVGSAMCITRSRNPKLLIPMTRGEKIKVAFGYLGVLSTAIYVGKPVVYTIRVRRLKLSLTLASINCSYHRYSPINGRYRLYCVSCIRHRASDLCTDVSRPSNPR